MTFSIKNFEERPYDTCLGCVHIGKNCDGPNFLAMTTERWCEWCRLRKEYLGWTNSHVAEIAGVSKISIDRIMSGNVKDLRTTTMQAVTKALVNGSWGQYPCAMVANTDKEEIYVDNPALVAECERLQRTLDNLIADHKKEMEEIHASEQRKVDFLREQINVKDKQIEEEKEILSERYKIIKVKDRAIAILAVLLGISLTAIIGALVADVFNPEVGFFWKNTLFGGF